MPASQRNNLQRHCFNYLVISPQSTSLFLCLLLFHSVALNLPSMYHFEIWTVRSSLQLFQSYSKLLFIERLGKLTETRQLPPFFSSHKCFQGFKTGDLRLLLPTHFFSFLVNVKPRGVPSTLLIGHLLQQNGFAAADISSFTNCNWISAKRKEAWLFWVLLHNDNIRSFFGGEIKTWNI